MSRSKPSAGSYAGVGSTTLSVGAYLLYLADRLSYESVINNPGIGFLAMLAVPFLFLGGYGLLAATKVMMARRPKKLWIET